MKVHKPRGGGGGRQFRKIYQIYLFSEASLDSIVLVLKFFRFQTNFKGGGGKGLAKGSVSRRSGLAAEERKDGKGESGERHERSFDQGASVIIILQLFDSILILTIIITVIIIVVMVILRRQQR